MSMAEFRRVAEAQRAPAQVTEGGAPDLPELVRLGTLAANSHNTQPWRVRLGDGTIRLRPDPARRCPVVDPDDAHLWRSLGCAAENIVQGAQGQAQDAAVTVDADGVEIRLAPRPPRPPDALFHAIPQRQCCKRLYDGTPLWAAELRALEAAGGVAQARCVLLTEAAPRAALADLVAEGNRVQMDDPALRAELIGWMRFSDRDAIGRGDGLAGRVLGMPSVPAALGRRLVGWLLSGRAQARSDRRALASSPAVAVIVAAGSGPAVWVAAGRASQRLQLQATALGLASAFLNQPVEVPALRPRLDALLGLSGGVTAQLILRLGRGPRVPFSLRRPVAEVLDR